MALWEIAAICSSRTSNAVQMLEIPSCKDGLAWIASRCPDKLLLIHGLQPAYIQDAANGDEQALNHLKTTARSDVTNTHDLSDCDLHDLMTSHSNPVSTVYGHMWAAGYSTEAHEQHVAHTIEVLRAAVKEGRLSALQWLRVMCQPVDPTRAILMFHAADSGDVQILKYLHTRPNNAPWSHYPATRSFSPPVSDFLIAEQLSCPVSPSLLDHYAFNGDLEALKKLHACGNLPFDYRNAPFQIASRCRHTRLTEWLVSLEPPCIWDAESLWCAVYLDDFQMVRQMRRQDPLAPWHETCALTAATNDNLELLQWMRAQASPCPLDNECCQLFAEHANLAAIQWLRGQQPSCPWGPPCTAAAAAKGSLELLQWMRGQSPPCPWDVSTSIAAAEFGDVTLVKWIYDQGGPIGADVYQCAITERHVPLLQWLHDSNIPKPTEDLGDWLRIDTPVLLLLAEIGVPMSDSVKAKLILAQRSYCTFHGLVRWCARASPMQKTQHQCPVQADSEPTPVKPAVSSRDLLFQLSQISNDLFTRIAAEVGLPCNILRQ